MRQLCAASILLLSASLAAHAQATLQSVNLIQPTGKGRITVPLSEQRQWKTVISAPGGGPILSMHDTVRDFEIVYMITPNKGTTAKDCLDDVMQHTETGLATGASKASIKQENKTESKSASGQPIAMGSFVIVAGNNIKVPEQYAYSMIATRDTCAQMNIRKSEYSAADDSAIQSELKSLSFDADYAPINADYVLMAALLNKFSRGFGSAPYYQHALDTLPPDAPKAARRGLIDQLSMAYARSRQTDKAKPINDAAIKTDAGYPMYYYNLARIDADDERAKDAQVHLQQAWDRKANLPAGQQMPDPTQDPSFQKLKTKSDFWAYVQSLK